MPHLPKCFTHRLPLSPWDHRFISPQNEPMQFVVRGWSGLVLGRFGRGTRKRRILPPSLVTTTTLKMGFHRRRRRQSAGGYANPETTPGDGWTNREPCQEACVGILPAPKGRKHFRAFVVHKIRLRLSLPAGWGANKALILESISFRSVLLFGPERRDIGMPLTCRRSHPKCLSRRV